MNNALQDSQTQEVYELMASHFNIGELKSIFYEFSIDPESVPQPATKQDYIRHILYFFASRNIQQELLNKLARLRPRVFWPKSFSIPEIVDSSMRLGQISVGTFIREQNVNINLKETHYYPKPKNSSRSRTSQRKTTNKTEIDLYNKIFFHTKKYVLLMMFLFILLPTTMSVTLYYNIDLWESFGLLLIIGYIVLAYGICTLVFRIVYGKVSKYTNFYQLSVSNRERIKGSLLNRSWGNHFWNISCRLMIAFLLETNKIRANQRKKFKS